MEGLSETERRIVDFVREGRLDAEIAVRLGMPVGDVKARIEALLRRYGLASRAELGSAALQRPAGFVPATPIEVYTPEPIIGGESPSTDGEDEVFDLPERRSARIAWGLVGLAVAGGLAAFAIWAGFLRGDDADSPETGSSVGSLSFDALSTEDEMRMLDESIRAPLADSEAAE